MLIVILQALKKHYIDDHELKSLHELFRSKAGSWHDQRKKMGDLPLVKSFRQKLFEGIDKDFEDHKKFNNAKKVGFSHALQIFPVFLILSLLQLQSFFCKLSIIVRSWLFKTIHFSRHSVFTKLFLSSFIGALQQIFQDLWIWFCDQNYLR